MEKDDSFLANITREGELEVTPTESLPEKETEEEAPAEGEVPAEDNLPFHKHPRWIERENELKEIREHDAQVMRELEELKAFKQEQSRQTDIGIPDWFQELYGDNEVAWEKYAKREQEREAEIEQRVLSKQIQAQQAQQQETERWSKWVDDEIGKLEAEGHTFDRNKLIKDVMLKYRPTDVNNNFDFKAGIEIYNALEQKDTTKSQARKALADTQTSSKGGEKPARDYETSTTLRNRSWGSL